ncbi:MAG: AAA family ATPase [Pseudomonadota bacterium]
MPPAVGRIIILHGASSSGKSTLARVLQNCLDTPFLHLSIDHFRDSGAIPMTRFRAGEFDWARYRSDLFSGFHNALAGFADAGNNMIVEHILDTPGWHASLQNLLKDHSVLFVGMLCDRDVLLDREHQRGDRPIGSALQDASSVHRGMMYDLELDGTQDPESNARRIIQALAGPYKRSGFFKTL